jgi:hypothetical protein
MPDTASHTDTCHVPQDLREALQALRRTLRDHRRDWTRQAGDARLAAILDADDSPTGDTALPELARRHGWTADEVARLRVYRRAITAAVGGHPATPPPFRSRRDAAAFLAVESRHPRYAGEDGIQFLLDHPETADHAYRSAQHANSGLGPDYLTRLTSARNLLATEENT